MRPSIRQPTAFLFSQRNPAVPNHPGLALRKAFSARALPALGGWGVGVEGVGGLLHGEALAKARTGGRGTVIQRREKSQASPTSLSFPASPSTNLFLCSHSSWGLPHPQMQTSTCLGFRSPEPVVQTKPSADPAASSTQTLLEWGPWSGLFLRCSEATLSLCRALLCALNDSPPPAGRKMR